MTTKRARTEGGLFQNHAKVSQVECPKCGAQPGEWECRGIFGVHDERWHLVIPPRKTNQGL